MNPSANKAETLCQKTGLMSGCAISAVLAIPAAVSAGIVLAQPAEAQTVIGTNHYTQVNLGNYPSNAPVDIQAGTVIEPAAGNAMFAAGGTGWSISNAGLVKSATGAGISLGVAGDISNLGGATIAGVDAIRLDDGGGVVNNAGGTLSADGYGVRVAGATGSVANAGVITAGYDGVSLNRGGQVANSGTVFGGHIGVYTGNGLGEVSNSGLISAATGDAVSIYGGGSFVNNSSGRAIGGYSGVYAGGNGASVQNAGIISGPDFGIYLAGASQITNSGSIHGGIDGVIGVGADAVLTNSGDITGGNTGVRLAANARLENTGTIFGGGIGVKLGNGGQLSNGPAGFIEGGDIGLLAGNNVVINNAGTVLDSTVAGIEIGSGGQLVNTGAIGGVTGLLVTGGNTNIFNSGVIAATVPGGNAIELQGADHLTLATGAEIFGNIQGDATASDITLQGNGTLAANIVNFGAGSVLDVAPGADWTASGDWDIARVNNAGTFQPGIIGTALDLTGDFAQSPAGVTRVLVTPTQTTAFNITGDAQLGGELLYVLAPGAYEPATEGFLSASGGITGSFASIATLATASAVQAPANPPMVLLQEDASHDLSLEVTRSFVVAPADDALFADANQMMALDGERGADTLLGHAVTKAAPCAAGAVPGAAGGAAGIAGALASGFCQAGGWVEAAGTNMNEADGYGARNAGFLAGLDRMAGDAGTRLGIAAGYDETSLADKAGGKASLDTVRIGLYGAQPLGSFMLSGGIMDGIVTSRTTRETGAGLAAGNAGGNVFSGALQIARPMLMAGTSLVPMMGLQIANVNSNRLSETARSQAFAISTSASGGTSLRPYLRLAASRDFITASNIAITPVASIGVTYQASGADGSVTVTAHDGTPFSTQGVKLDAAAGQLMAGVTAGRGNCSLEARVSAQIAGNWSSETAEAQVQVRF